MKSATAEQETRTRNTAWATGETRRRLGGGQKKNARSDSMEEGENQGSREGGVIQTSAPAAAPSAFAGEAETGLWKEART
jgi:hypothetical protein